MEGIDWRQLLTDNATLAVNTLSVIFGLFVGIVVRGRFIDKKRLDGNDALDFLFFTVVFIYITLAATFSNVPLPFWGYAIMGIVAPPFTVPIYNSLVAYAPQMVKSLLPEGILKWILEHTTPPNDGKGD